jgi:hypothetical protein
MNREDATRAYRPTLRFGDPGFRLVKHPSSSMYFAIGLGRLSAGHILRFGQRVGLRERMSLHWMIVIAAIAKLVSISNQRIKLRFR